MPSTSTSRVVPATCHACDYSVRVTCSDGTPVCSNCGAYWPSHHSSHVAHLYWSHRVHSHTLCGQPVAADMQVSTYVVSGATCADCVQAGNTPRPLGALPAA